VWNEGEKYAFMAALSKCTGHQNLPFFFFFLFTAWLAPRVALSTGHQSLSFFFFFLFTAWLVLWVLSSERERLMFLTQDV
jgi:hypothetical protein